MWLIPVFFFSFVEDKMLQISGIKIIRVYGDLIEEEEYPIPNKRKPLKTSTKDEVKTLDEGLKAIALHHVIRSEKCPFASELRDYELTLLKTEKTMWRHLNQKWISTAKWDII